MPLHLLGLVEWQRDWQKGEDINRKAEIQKKCICSIRNVFAPKEIYLHKKNIFAPKELKFAPKEWEFAPKLSFAPRLLFAPKEL